MRTKKNTPEIETLMPDNELLDLAAMICVTSHAGQVDRMGQSYFQHPMRVAMRCQTLNEKIVGLLHDTIEDTQVTAVDLLAHGFPQEIVDAVVAITKGDDEPYFDYVERCAKNPLARAVKLHDLEDNLDIFRLDEVNEDMRVRYNKYLKAYRFLQSLTNSINDPILSHI